MAFDLNSIKRGTSLKAPRIVVYGVDGVGKSTFAANAPNPIFIRTEDGLGTIDTTYFGDMVTNTSDLFAALSVLYNAEHDFKTLVIDSIDWLERILRTEIEQEIDPKDLAFGRYALVLAERWGTILDTLNTLRNDRNMAIILIAHTEIKRFDSPETEPYDRYQLKLQDRGAALIQEWADAVFFANYKTFVKAEDAGFNKKVTRGIATGQRVLYTQETPAYHAKNRYSLPKELPFTWADFATHLPK